MDLELELERVEMIDSLLSERCGAVCTALPDMDRRRPLFARRPPTPDPDPDTNTESKRAEADVDVTAMSE